MLIVSGILLMFSDNDTNLWLLASRIVGGFTQGLIYVVVIVHASENATKEFRELLMLIVGAVINYSILVSVLSFFHTEGLFKTGLLNGLGLTAFGVLTIMIVSKHATETVPFILQTNGSELDALQTVSKLKKKPVAARSVHHDFLTMKNQVQDEIEHYGTPNFRKVLLPENRKSLVFCCYGRLCSVLSFNLPLIVMIMLFLRHWVDNSFEAHGILPASRGQCEHLLTYANPNIEHKEVEFKAPSDNEPKEHERPKRHTFTNGSKPEVETSVEHGTKGDESEKLEGKDKDRDKGGAGENEHESNKEREEKKEKEEKKVEEEKEKKEKKEEEKGKEEEKKEKEEKKKKEEHKEKEGKKHNSGEHEEPKKTNTEKSEKSEEEKNGKKSQQKKPKHHEKHKEDAKSKAQEEEEGKKGENKKSEEQKPHDQTNVMNVAVPSFFAHLIVFLHSRELTLVLLAWFIFGTITAAILYYFNLKRFIYYTACVLSSVLVFTGIAHSFHFLSSILHICLIVYFNYVTIPIDVFGHCMLAEAFPVTLKAFSVASVAIVEHLVHIILITLYLTEWFHDTIILFMCVVAFISHEIARNLPQKGNLPLAEAREQYQNIDLMLFNEPKSGYNQQQEFI